MNLRILMILLIFIEKKREEKIHANGLRNKKHHVQN